MPTAASPSSGTTGTPPAEQGIKFKFDPKGAQPPKIERKGRRSPYLPSDEDLAVLLTIMQKARDTDNAWISPIDPRITETRARIAMNAYKDALAALLDVKDRGAFAGRVWQCGSDPDRFQFALALKKGAE